MNEKENAIQDDKSTRYDYKESCLYFHGGYCSLTFLYCPHWLKENNMFVPKGCQDMVSAVCTYYVEEE